MIAFLSKRLDVTDPVRWYRAAPGDERQVCHLFDRWPDDPERPALGGWTGGGLLSYDASIAGISAQIVADHDIDYQGAFADAAEARCVRSAEAAAMVTSEVVVLASVSENAYLDLEDVLAWMVACGLSGVVRTLVGYGTEADDGLADLDALDPSIAVIGWPEL
ncbi:MAG: hypothetical protein F4112_15950 [Holophagales bacterium]|nr:hypothetical protein [Holophagales bacterium]MYB20867.1 hypothetical protein [Holophagales bacterium]MYD21131.1 hypothetical protein [Holophagales bacterium]MYH25508.1 hypothetical protein [Holophagales bacterium]MYI34442.1 hypothetical protein [Holophagales bacterium]